MKKYIPANFEQKWIDRWQKDKTYKTVDGKEKMYILDMFPYPSGAGLHVGHPRGYTATDILARYYRMNGYGVLHPMGWDAFGLPAENAAIKAKKNPIDMVPLNIENFKRQMMMLGFSYDWDREFTTTDPSYYKWTQWLFIQFFKMGLLYKKNTPINFCPFCKTGLAEEEVLPNGTHERCGNPITKKDLPQWIFRITAYADRLTEDLKGLQWPQGILDMQKNWIGRKEGINITYPVEGTDESVVCFTTRPDTNFGATFIVLAPEHEFVKKMINDQLVITNKNSEELEKRKPDIKEYVEKTKSKTELERQMEGRKKTGVFTGFYVLNRLNNKLLPIWISDFVLAQFGTGAVVGVPGHDLRDFEFAQEFNIPIQRVVVSKDGDTSPIVKKEQVYENGGSIIESDFLNGLDTQEAIQKVINYLEKKEWGKRIVTYHIRDWIFSRQRYWGEPIPMIFCPHCAKNQVKSQKSKLKSFWTEEMEQSMAGWFPLEEKQLPLELPYVTSYEPSDTGESPLAHIETFVKTICPNCGGEATRETDTMPNWAGSCWYFIRFAQNKKIGKEETNEETWKELMKSNGADKWLPVDWYVGGAEHAVLHLLYARFWMKALHDIGLVEAIEPFMRLRNVGMILAQDHRKMSKSWGNVINPDDVVKDFGADALRTYEMFMAPFSQEIAWSTESLQGVYRFLGRVWNIFHNEQFFTTEPSEEDKRLVDKLNRTIIKVSKDIVEIKFNTAIAAMMEYLNLWESRIGEKYPRLTKDKAKKLLQILAPFAPFITEEIWYEVLGEKQSIHLSPWPLVDEKELLEQEKKVPVQVNGKVRAVLTVQTNSKDEIVAQAMQDEKVKKFIGENKFEVVYVQDKILNFVVKQ
jgi:leucyl-tRNA synthetase